VRDYHRRFAVEEDFKCDVETLCALSCSGIGSVWFRETCIIPVLRSVARRRLVKPGNPSVCAMVKCELCKSLYGLYLSVIKCECVTNC
jgi:hypothetical protein